MSESMDSTSSLAMLLNPAPASLAVANSSNPSHIIHSSDPSAVRLDSFQRGRVFHAHHEQHQHSQHHRTQRSSDWPDFRKSGMQRYNDSADSYSRPRAHTQHQIYSTSTNLYPTMFPQQMEPTTSKICRNIASYDALTQNLPETGSRAPVPPPLSKRKFDNITQTQQQQPHSSTNSQDNRGSSLAISPASDATTLDKQSVEAKSPRIPDAKRRAGGSNNLMQRRSHSKLGYAACPERLSRTKVNNSIRSEKNPGIKTNASIDDDRGHLLIVPETKLGDRYKICKLLGQGTFGKVVLANDMVIKDKVAIKIIRAVPKYREAALGEIRTLDTLRSNDPENRYQCIYFRDCFEFHGHICIVTDLHGCSVFDFLKSNNFAPLPETHVQSIGYQLLTSVAFLHEIGLVHTDLKPENILLEDASYFTCKFDAFCPSSRATGDGDCKERKVLGRSDCRLIDFGSATFDDEYHSSVVSTRHYRAPEVLMGLQWSYACDLWSIGCILVELMTGDALFQTHDNLEHLALMEKFLGTKISVDMVQRMRLDKGLKKNPSIGLFKDEVLQFPGVTSGKGSVKTVGDMKLLEQIIPPTNRFNTQLLDLLKKLLTFDPKDRITAKEALDHPWFSEALQDDGTAVAMLPRNKIHILRPGTRPPLTDNT